VSERRRIRSLYPFDFRDGMLGFNVTLPPLSVAAAAFQFAPRDRD